MKLARLSRRKFFVMALLAAPSLAVADALKLEPGWIRTRKIRFGDSKTTHRFVHFTDLHHRGDRDYLQGVAEKINSLSPEFVCFTGDIVEETQFLPEALSIIRSIKSPVFGVPGNHDYWSRADFTVIAEAFNATGGAWLLDQQMTTRDANFNIIGATCEKPIQFALQPNQRNILLIHYPEWADKVGKTKLDLILAGHSHGGQVRLPFYGPLILPFGVGAYDLGLFQTSAGPLYVNAGIGYFYANVRFNCRPEITVFEM